ncbi:hypothetical protein CPC08DRAFT_708489 [Agrocybe pediades]|nr:hypothetical protein CPC08DRAFT_708489 [Agrocybe pediades]
MMAGAGYFMGNAGNGAGNALGNHGAISMLGGLLGQFFDDNTAPRTRKTRPSKKSQPKMKPRPKAWESFNRHNEWQNQQRNPGHDDNDQFQQLMNMVSGAGQILSGNWWNVIKSAAATGEKSTEKKGPEAAQKPAKKTRSR